MKLFFLLLILSNSELIKFRALAEETNSDNSSTPLELAISNFFSSEKTSPANSTIQNTKGENFNGATTTEIIPKNETTEETTPQKTTSLTPTRETSITGINSTRETSTEVITSSFIPEIPTPTTASASIHESIKNGTSDPAPKTTSAQEICTFNQTLEKLQSFKATPQTQNSTIVTNFPAEDSSKSFSIQHSTLRLTPALELTTVALENLTQLPDQKMITFNQSLETIQTTQAILPTENSSAIVTSASEISTKSISSQHPTLGLTPASELTTVALENLTQLSDQKMITFNQSLETIQTTRAILPTENSSAIVTSTSKISTKPISSQNTASISTPALNQPPQNTSIANFTTQIIKPYNTTRKPTNTTRSKKKKKASKIIQPSTSRKTRTPFSRISHTYTKYEWTGTRTDPTFKEIDYRESNEFGEESFKKFMIRTSIYVDKSLLIKKFLDHPRQVILLTRPRFWGKSLNLNMLRKFFEIEVDSQGKILSQECQTNRRMFCGGYISNQSYSKTFHALKISKIPEAMEHQGKHPVIQLNYNFILKGTYDEMEMGVRMEIIRSFKKHFYLETYFKSNPDLLDDSKRSQFERYCNGNLTTQDLIHSIRFLTELLHKYFNQTVFVLIDEYDAPLAEAFRQSSEEPENLEDMLHFYRLMYTNAFSDNKFLAKAFITGKLRIENSYLFVNLRNVAEYTLLDHEFNEFYGFTEQEVDELLKMAPNETIEEVKEYYRGYNYGGQIMYNPWSIKQCIENNYTLRSYWLQTGILLPAHRRKFSLEGVQQDIKSLLGGGCVQIPIKNEVTFNGLEDGNKFFNFILFTGYLSPVEINPNGTHNLVKPNTEANYFYNLLLGDWIYQHFVIFGRSGVTYPIDYRANYTFMTATTSSNATRATKKSRFGLKRADGNSTRWPTTELHSSEISLTQNPVNFTYNLSQSFEKYEIVPHIIPVAPSKLLRVFYPKGEVKPETAFVNEDMNKQPKLHWDADENSYYTLYLLSYQHKENYTDPFHPRRPQWHNWIVVNIPGNDLASGEVLYRYVPPRNPVAYVNTTVCVSALIYKQINGIAEFEPWKGGFHFRQYSPVVDFAANYSLGDPEFGNLFIMKSVI